MITMLRFALLFFACVCIGCGPADGIERVPITGLLTVQGKPLPGATLSFTPVGETAGPGAIGRSDAEGKFEVISSRERHEGIPPGEYTVRVSLFVMPDGTPLPPEVPQADAPRSRQSVPPPFSSPNSPLKVVIPKEGGAVKVDIPAKLLIPLKSPSTKSGQ